MEVIDLAQHFSQHLNKSEQITLELLASNVTTNTLSSDEKASGLLGNYICNHTVRISAKTDLFHYEFVSTLNTSLSNGAECMANGKLSVLGFMPTFTNDREVIKSYPARLFAVNNSDNTTGTNDDKMLAAIKWLNAIADKNDEKAFGIDIINFSKVVMNNEYSTLAGSGGFGTPEYQLRNAITNKANCILQASNATKHDGKQELMYAVYNMHNQGLSSVIHNLANLLTNTAIPNP